MLHINMNDILSADEEEIAERLLKAGPELRVTMSVSDQYRANSKAELAENWLKSWYVAESLASNASQWNCQFAEGEDGAGEFEFRFVVTDLKGMAGRIAEFAPLFDPDDLEFNALIYDEAHDWLDARGEIKARFPDLEESYRGDAEMAKEYEGDVKEDEECD